MIQRQLLPSLLIPVLLCVGCGKSDSNGSTAGDATDGGKRQFISMGTAPVGGTLPAVGQAICDVLNQHKGTIDWKLSPKGTKGSQENIRRLQQNELELGLSNAAISYFAARGEAGWNEKYDIREVAHLAPNVAMFITRADSGIQSISDLKGKRVITGPAGAGFQLFVEPILLEHGVSWSDITSINSTQSDSVDQLADGSADAAFLGGAVPTASISQAASTFDLHFVPFDETARQALIEKYPFFHSATIPAGTYTGLDGEFLGLNVGSMQLITSAAEDEELIYQITKTIWENRDEIAAQHPAGKSINPANVATDSGIEYHPGAIRFYQEAGIWPGSEQETPSSDNADAGSGTNAEPAGEQSSPELSAPEQAAPEHPHPNNPLARRPDYSLVSSLSRRHFFLEPAGRWRMTILVFVHERFASG